MAPPGSVAPGDHVVISFPWCGGCPNCRQRAFSYCLDARKLKSSGTRADGSTLMCVGDDPVYSAFFQQSSFGSHAISNERFVIKVRNDAPLDRLGPFGCSIQTGAGAVLNAMRPKPGDSCVVFGVGAVGLSGLMAAKHAGCDPLIAVDVHEARLKLARELGATHVIDHAKTKDVVAEIKRITGNGARFSLETSALPAVFREAVECLMPVGTCVLVGTARAGTEVTFQMPVMQNGRTVRGVIQGDSEPDVFIPQLVDLMMDGKLPAERMMTFYDLADINRAAKDSSDGRTIVPVARIANSLPRRSTSQVPNGTAGMSRIGPTMSGAASRGYRSEKGPGCATAVRNRPSISAPSCRTGSRTSCLKWTAPSRT